MLGDGLSMSQASLRYCCPPSTEEGMPQNGSQILDIRGPWGLAPLWWPGQWKVACCLLFRPSSLVRPGEGSHRWIQDAEGFVFPADLSLFDLNCTMFHFIMWSFRFDRTDNVYQKGTIYRWPLATNKSTSCILLAMALYDRPV